jgi:hypothetical protein
MQLSQLLSADWTRCVMSRLEPTERRVQIVTVLFGGRTEYCAFLACSLRGLKHSNSAP